MPAPALPESPVTSLISGCQNINYCLGYMILQVQCCNAGSECSNKTLFSLFLEVAILLLRPVRTVQKHRTPFQDGSKEPLLACGKHKVPKTSHRAHIRPEPRAKLWLLLLLLIRWCLMAGPESENTLTPVTPMLTVVSYDTSWPATHSLLVIWKHKSNENKTARPWFPPNAPPNAAQWIHLLSLT